MPKDPKAIRTPSFRAKLSQLKGLAPDEKALMQRIGQLLDTFTLAQRQTQNPRQRRRLVKTFVPKPTNVTVLTITGGVQISWDRVDLKELDFYELDYSESAIFEDATTLQIFSPPVSIRASPASGTLFLRVRTVTKRGEVSPYTNTVSLSVAGSSVFSADQDHIEPENRTTVSPKPKLLGASLDNEGDESFFTGIGAHVGPSPLTLDDDDIGFRANTDIRHEITYNLHDSASPFPGIEDRVSLIDEFIDEDKIGGFYNYEPSFYIRFGVLPYSLSDFFTVGTMPFDPANLDVEFLRYRILNNFYFPDFNQAGYVLNAALSTIKF